MTNLSPHILTSPALVYALKNTNVDPFLVDIFNTNKEECDNGTARRYFSTCLEAAKDGALLAMTMCAGFYAAGWGVEKSIDEALMWADKAAASNFAPGFFDLGIYYEQGIGVGKDINKALDYYESAINAGFGFPALHVAWLFHNGEIVKKDIRKALMYGKRAYELGELSAAGVLAAWYEDGDDSIKDENEAVVWYKRGAADGDPLASSRLSMAYTVGQLGLPVDIELANKYQKMSELQMSEIETNGRQ